MVLAVRHGEHCDADLRETGCVCAPREERGTEAVARVMDELANDMAARERDALERREYKLAHAYRNRLDAYRHAAQVATNISDSFRAQVGEALASRYRRIRADQVAGVSGGDDLARKRLLTDLMDELDLWPFIETPW